ncbi:ZrgA family zinc uptake protein [Hyphomonas johnsonii]|jgi:hypothetical protein|uniref:Putative lipoprotein n=1 Tax=Hyphomonas johnsonii MHS-2 TaxID=1280950 RepID=A0A059FHG3_9PROT|nr:DUF2796 domain-containing protein [Hyphomonas johnsonii]KCZ90069.1 putative lipoprotein [Hyphomonas johnsonii MHS-2]
MTTLISPSALSSGLVALFGLGLTACGPAAPTPEAAAPIAAVAESPVASEPGPDSGTGEIHEAHVHGSGDLAVTVDGDVLTVTLDAPLANFGLGESDAGALQISTGIGDHLVTFTGAAGCKEGDRDIQTRTNGDHAALTLTVTFACAKLAALDGVRLNVFSEFPGFQSVDAVFIGPDMQTASVLTAANPELAVN